MPQYQKTKSEVNQFLEKVKRLITYDGRTTINNRPWAKGRVNKTLTYMAETGITKQDICRVVQELEVCNYCYTADDRNERFPNEQVWVFGITKKLIDKEESLYIKLKIRIIKEEILLIMSFHPENPGMESFKLKFPYKD
ncbi:type II toxin-antitoxin system MqsR family toxin [Faecalicatena faecalis]|nr:type II toxin-antitoxin system MqsR family toxin [Faecalicatena faecalis]